MDRLLPTPTPQDIEAALTAIRDGTIAYVRWRRLDEQIEVVFIPIHDGVSVYWGWLYNSENFCRPSAHTDRLWWVTIIDPDGEEFGCFGGGTTLAEAAAVAWINSCIGFDWSKSGLSDEDDAKVPRRMPEGWRFELYAAPVRPPALREIESSRNQSSEKARQRDRSPWSERL